MNNSMKKWGISFSVGETHYEGWINTMDENHEYPETLSGSFWTSKDSEGVHGEFVLDDGTTGYVLMKAYTEVEVQLRRYYEFETKMMTYKEEVVLDSWERIDKRIEDCLNDSYTYVHWY